MMLLDKEIISLLLPLGFILLVACNKVLFYADREYEHVPGLGTSTFKLLGALL
jgi:hypothetical protein